MSKRNWNRAARRAASLLVALCMLCALVPAGLADDYADEFKATVITDGQNATGNFENVQSDDEHHGGIYVKTDDGFDATATVTGEIVGDVYPAAHVYAYGKDSDATLNSGDITSTAEQGVIVVASVDGVATLSADDITNTKGAGNADLNEGDGLCIFADNGGEATVKAGDVKATGEALDVNASPDSKVEATVDSAISERDTAVDINANGGKAEVTVSGDGNVAVEGTKGMYVQASYGGEASMTVSAGKVKATGNDSEDYGVDVRAWQGYSDDAKGGKVEVTVNGEVESNRGGARVYVEGASEADVYLNSNVTAEKGSGIYVYAEGDGAVANVEAGNVTSNGSSRSGLNVVAKEGSKVSVVAEDVTSADAGLSLKVDKGASADIFIDGTLSGKYCGVSESVNGEATLTVWKLECEQGNDSMVKPNGSSATSASDFLAGINYLVKIAEDCKELLKALNASGGALATSHEQAVAREGETIRLTIGDLTGVQLDGVYNGDKALEKDADGSFIWKVVRGGGMLFSAKTSAIAPDPKPEPSPEPTKEPEPSPEPSPEPTKDPEPSPSPTPKPDDSGDDDDDDDYDDAPKKAVQSQELATIAVVESEDPACKLTFFINSGFSIRHADGTTEKGAFEMNDGVPTLMNSAGEKAVLNSDGALSFGSEGEAVTLADVTQRYLRATFPDGHEEEGSFELADGAIALVNAKAEKTPVGEDGGVTFVSADGQQRIEAALDGLSLAVVRAALG